MPIHYERRDDHVVVITIDRPESRNSLDLHHFRDLAKAWKDFRYDDEAWVAIITGVDGNFMSGADLKTYIPQITELAKQIGAGEVAEIDGCRLEDGTRAVLRNVRLYKPIIAAIDGPCVAGGMEMLGGVDIRIATARATFGMMEPKRGLFAGGGTTARLPRQLAFPAAMEFLLTAEAFPASRPRTRAVERDRRARPTDAPRHGVGGTDLRQRTPRRAGHQGISHPRTGRHARRRLRHRSGALDEDLRHRGRQGRSARLQGEASAELDGPVTQEDTAP